MGVTLVGDCHGKYDRYYNIAKGCEYTIQLGDFGFSDAWNRLGYSDLDPNKHKVIKGNHDSYGCPQEPHNLGDFGEYTLNGISFFFVRGGISIDRTYRQGEQFSGGKKTYWTQEELSFTEMLACMDAYKKSKAKILLTHCPPAMICDELAGNKGHGILQRFGFHVGFRENTALLLDELIKIRKPDECYFGHFHTSYAGYINGTLFRCLDELETAELCEK
jgi:predicted phosphodiesterase